MSSVNVTSKLTPSQWAVIRGGVVKGRDPKAVHDEVCAERSATQKVVREAMEKVAQEFSARGEVKREGAHIVQEFLKKAKEGADVDDMAAILESAVYRDILRRYAESPEPLVSMTMDQLLKIDLSYRSARLSKAKANGADGNSLAAKIALTAAMEAFGKILNMADDSIRPAVAKLEQQLNEWAKEKFGEDNLKEFLKEKNEIERLSELVRSRRDGQREAGSRAAAGLAG